MIDRPSIVEVISAYTPLRKSGKEFVGLCPLHSEKTASFYLNEDKGTFYCHGCHEGGDVIAFIQKIEGLDFKGAIAHLGITDQPRPTRAVIKKRETIRQASRKLEAWALSVSENIGTRMRGIGQREYMATKVLNELDSADEEILQNEVEGASREWFILATLEEDLLDPNRTVELWQERELIDQLVGDRRTYSNEEIKNMYPPLTDAYRKRLTRYVGGEA